jgi:hypothetical protein
MTKTMLAEKKISLAALARREGVNPTTCWRWAGRGVEGIVLESFSIGGRRWTTEEAFERWVAAVTAKKAGASIPAAPTGPSNDAAASAVERELQAAGF